MHQQNSSKSLRNSGSLTFNKKVLIESLIMNKFLLSVGRGTDVRTIQNLYQLIN